MNIHSPNMTEKLKDILYNTTFLFILLKDPL